MKKYFAPIFIVILGLFVFFIYTLGYFFVIDKFSISLLLKPFLIIIFASLSIAFIILLIQRIKEIKEEEKDDD